MPKTHKKKILYVITKSNWGGAQRYVFNLATNLPKDYEVTVALGGEGTLKKRLVEADIRTISIPSLGRDVKIFSDFLVLKQLVSLFKKEKPDIIHVNSSKIGGLGALAGRIAKVPKIIFTAHGWAFREERPKFQKIVIKFFSWLTVLFSHKVITVSKRDEREGLEMPFSKNKIELINNGIDEPEFLKKEEARDIILEKSPLSTREQILHSPETVWVGTIGELHKNKGHLYAIEALASLQIPGKFIFFIIGEGEERLALEKTIRDLGMEGKIILLGKMDGASLLPAFDIFLFPSIKEGLPYALLEAGFAGIPIVASAVGGIPEIVEDMSSGILVRPKSPEEITKALDFLISHPKERLVFGKKIRANVKKNFSFKKMLGETEEVYEDRKV